MSEFSSALRGKIVPRVLEPNLKWFLTFEPKYTDILLLIAEIEVWILVSSGPFRIRVPDK
jgi:hypothetical protein